MADQPREVIASKYLPDRLDKYRRLAPHRRQIAAQQFNLSEAQIKRNRPGGVLRAGLYDVT
jgi:hypothetical protein